MNRFIEYTVVIFIVALGGVLIWLAGERSYTVSHPPIIPTMGVPGYPAYPTFSVPQPPPAAGEVPKEITRGDTSRAQVIFTFDGGAGSQSFQPILDALAAHQVKSTFFLTGAWAEKYPDFVRKIAAQGHEIFNHTYGHPHLPQLPDDQIREEFQKTDEVIKSITNETTKPYFRPPYGDRNPHVLEVAWQEGYQSIFWTVDALDWKEGITATEVRERVVGNVKPGTIYLMHIGDDITGQILDEVIISLQEQGYSIVSLTQGLGPQVQ